MADIKRFAPPGGGRSFPPFSIAVAHGGTLYVSGLGPMDVQGQVPEGFAAQFGLVVTTLRTLLTGAGSGMDRILKVNVLLTRAEDVAEMNLLYREAFPATNLPARTTSVVMALPVPAFLLEIECVAAL